MPVATAAAAVAAAAATAVAAVAAAAAERVTAESWCNSDSSSRWIRSQTSWSRCIRWIRFRAAAGPATLRPEGSPRASGCGDAAAASSSSARLARVTSRKRASSLASCARASCNRALKPSSPTPRRRVAWRIRRSFSSTSRAASAASSTGRGRGRDGLSAGTPDCRPSVEAQSKNAIRRSTSKFERQLR